MTINSFEDILAWQKSKALTKEIYILFLDNRDFGFRDQIQRASVSVMNNIAEGFERRTKAEFRHFLYISKGSCGEVRSMLILARELGYVETKKCDELIQNASEISRIISGLIKSL